MANTLNAWGANAVGQLGDGTTTEHHNPVPIGSSLWRAVACGRNNWSLGIQNDFSLWAWGYDFDGELGNGANTDQHAPVAVTPFNDGCIAVSAGGLHTVAMGYVSGQTVYGPIYLWGDNSYGQLGTGDYTAYNTPQYVYPGGGAIAVAAGERHTVIVRDDGQLWACGYGPRVGNGGTDTNIFVQIDAGSWLTCAAGYTHSLAIKADGTLWAWGLNSNNQLGDGTTTQRLTPIQIGTATWVAVAAGGTFSLAIKSDGTLWAWGYNANGRLGDGTTTQRSTPTQIGTDTWTLIAAGFDHALGVKTAGTLWGWGNNANGQLGDGTVTERHAPTQVGTYAAVAIATGGAHSLGLFPNDDHSDGAVFADILTSSSTTTSGLADATIGADVAINTPTSFLNASGSVVDAAIGATVTQYLEAAGFVDLLASTAHTSLVYLDVAVFADSFGQVISQLVTEAATGADGVSAGIALTLAELASFTDPLVSTHTNVVLVAELIATLEQYSQIASQDVTDTAALVDAYTNRVAALVAQLEAAQITATNTAVVHVMQSVTDSAGGSEAITSTGSLLTNLLTDGVLATIRLNVGGELFTGWVLNTDTLAPSEYQFADLQFNSACKHGDRYLLAADDGIYQFTEDVGAETVMTYIKTGKTDFGSDLRKRVVNSYIVYSASGDMVLRVTTSEHGQVVTRSYAVTARPVNDTTDTRRIDIGKGIKSRYWQFELMGNGVDCDIDEIGMLPIVLSRRI